MSKEDQPEDRDYDVGYGRPPRHTRFKPGRSGNPNGRPRKTKQLTELIQAELDKKIPVTEDGRKKYVTKREAFVTRLVNGGIKGETKPFQALLEHINQHRPAEPFVSTEADDEALLKYVAVETSGEPSDDKT